MPTGKSHVLLTSGCHESLELQERTLYRTCPEEHTAAREKKFLSPTVSLWDSLPTKLDLLPTGKTEIFSGPIVTEQKIRVKLELRGNQLMTSITVQQGSEKQLCLLYL